MMLLQTRLSFRPVVVALWLLVTLTLPLVVAQDDGDPSPTPPLVATEDPGIAITLTPPARPTAASSVTVDGITLEMYFDVVPQGRVALMRVNGSDVSGARLRFRDRLSDFFLIDDGDDNDGYYGLLVTDMDLTPRVYDFSVFVWRENGSRVTLPAQVDVTLGGFVRQDFNLTPDRAHLIDAQLERTEFARLDAVFDTITPEKLWDEEGFSLPIESTITSPFGAFRLLNQTYETRHTGWDLRAATGTPVRTMAAGRVAYAGLLDIRGNHVIVDHGYGIFSGYSHLSQIHVTRGQTVSAGQIIGVSGNTGRSNGPHLHWEITVNGMWVDSIDFLRMWMP
jgi:hypothetical protein